jgi:outer membrane protein
MKEEKMNSIKKRKLSAPCGLVNNLFIMILCLAALADCAVEDSVKPHQLDKIDSITVKSAQGAPSVIEPVPEPVKPPFTLAQCIEIALKNNPDITGGNFDVLAARAGADIASSKRWPTIGLESSYWHYKNDQRLIQPRFGNEPGLFADDVFSGDVVIKMPIYTGGRITNEIKAANLLHQSTRHRLSRTRKELVFNISQVFYRILAQNHVAESLNFSKKAMAEHHKRVTDLVDVKKAAKVDLLRIEVRLTDLNQRLVAEKNVLSILRRVLGNLLGLTNTESGVDIKGNLKFKIVTPNLPEGISDAYLKRSDYLEARKEMESQARRLDIAQAGHLPVVSIKGSYGFRNAVGSNSSPSGTSSTEDVGFVGINIELPIFEGGRIGARIRQEHATMISMREHLRKLELQVMLEIETSVLNINSSQQRVEFTEKSIELAKESLRIEREKYELGKGSITDVLDSQAALLDTQTTYYQALANYNSSVAQLRLAIGE